MVSFMYYLAELQHPVSFVDELTLSNFKLTTTFSNMDGPQRKKLKFSEKEEFCLETTALFLA